MEIQLHFCPLILPYAKYYIYIYKLYGKVSRQNTSVTLGKGLALKARSVGLYGHIYIIYTYTSRLTIVSCEAKKKQPYATNEPVSYLHVAPL